MTAAAEKKARTQANRKLAALPVYHQFIPTGDIDRILEENGLQALEPAIYCGRSGRITEQVGERSFLCLTWMKMEVTGMFEIVSYIS